MVDKLKYEVPTEMRDFAEKSVEQARKAFDALGMTDVTMHRMRHWFGTMIQREFGDLRVTQECLRHANVSSTQIYTQVSDQQRVRAIDTLALPKVGPASH